MHICLDSYSLISTVSFSVEIIIGLNGKEKEGILLAQEYHQDLTH